METAHDKVLAIQNMTGKYVSELLRIWNECFGQKMASENLKKLEDHVMNFYDEIVEETADKRKYIEGAIADLRDEAENLRRLLKADVELPQLSSELPLIFVQSEMDKSLEELREQLRLRREQICELLIEQESLCEQLGEPPRELLADPLPSEAEIDTFRSHLDDMKELRIERMNRLSTMRREIRNCQKILDLQVSTDAEDRLLNHRDIKLNNETFAALQKLHDNYSRQVDELHLRIDEMRGKLETLWDRLQTTPRTRDKFQRHADYSQYIYDVLYQELQRCETLRSQNIKKFVQHIREEIAEWWDKTAKSDVERSRFTHFYSKNYTDDLLVLHELELEDLKRFYDTNEQIFQLFNDRKVLWDRMEALEAKANEPGRFNNRGGQLLKEEKERKTIASKLPKIEQQIRDMVQEYEEREHKPFLIYGDNILTLMSDEWEKKREAKEKISSIRKNTTAGRTPLSKSIAMTRTPLSMKNASSVGSVNKLSTLKNRSKMVPATTSQKRKMEPREQNGPTAKRSLMYALNSPTVFRLPTVAVTAATPQKRGTTTKLMTKASRIVASTLRRRSSIHKKNAKKRLSQGRNRSKLNNSRAVAAGQESEDERPSGSRAQYADEPLPYEYFQKCIEPDSRSSIIQSNTSSVNCTSMMSNEERRRRQMDLLADENARLAYLPKPRLVRAPSKQNMAGTPGRMSPHHPHHTSATSNCRKLTTKNLPIII